MSPEELHIVLTERHQLTVIQNRHIGLHHRQKNVLFGVADLVFGGFRTCAGLLDLRFSLEVIEDGLVVRQTCRIGLTADIAPFGILEAGWVADGKVITAADRSANCRALSGIGECDIFRSRLGCQQGGLQVWRMVIGNGQRLRQGLALRPANRNGRKRQGDCTGNQINAKTHCHLQSPKTLSAPDGVHNRRGILLPNTNKRLHGLRDHKATQPVWGQNTNSSLLTAGNRAGRKALNSARALIWPPARVKT